MLRTNRLIAGLTLSLSLGLAACADEEAFQPGNLNLVDPLFTRYVSMGNSITAGFQSGGINEATQNQSYAMILAQAMGTPFFVPLMASPGCPSLYTNVFTQTRVAPSIPCALRKTQAVPPPYINNVAVPGAEVMDAVSNLDTASNANALTTFFLGGLTQSQMMTRVQPTFVTVWMGNNDVLGSATNTTNAGNPALVTPTGDFQTRYAAMLAEIDNANPTGGALIGVANVTAIPYLSQGQAYFAAKAAGALPATFTVGPSCAPRALAGIGDSVLVPFPFGGALLAQASAGTPVTLTCLETQTVQPAELANLAAAVTAYNAYISAQAAARGFAYLDPNLALDSLRTQAPAGTVQPFPLFLQPCTANPFGTAFSCDAVHPSAATHRLIARKLREAINTTYGTTLPAIP